MAFCFTAAVPSKAEARTDVSIGIGVGVAPAYGYYGRPWRHAWGPRPYWYGARWYHPYSYWGPSFDFYAAFPLTTVRTWPEPARIYHRDAYSAAIGGPLGEAFSWDDGYDHGYVTAVRDGYSGDRYCREFRQVVSIGGRTEEGFNAACRGGDGVWRVVPDNP
jgi:hypothetical protein